MYKMLSEMEHFMMLSFARISGGTRMFFCGGGGIEGANCVSKGENP